MAARALALLATSGLVASGCSEPDLTCASEDDCFMGQYCVEGACQDDPPMVTVNNAGNNQVSNNQTTANNQVANNQTTGTNQTTANNQTAGNMMSNMTSPVIACLDPPLTCPNEESPESSGGSSSTIKPEEGDPPPARFGCVRLSDQEIVGLERQLTGAVCASDFEGDRYSIEYQRCRDIDLLIEMTLTVDPTTCTDEEVEVEWRADCDGVTVRCEEDHDLEAGIWRFRAVIARIDTVVAFQNVVLDVAGEKSGTQFDYTLDVKVSDASEP